VYLWAAAVEKAGSTDVDKVKEAAKGLEFKAPEGLVKIEGENQHLWKPVRIGEVQADGLIQEIWSTGEAVKPDPYLKSYEWA
ncbi:MAG TPA: urea ABC transporter substrate-binding protein, partial [Pelotomaculum sp.]|nr:urea ABC transporter substrate-binding protein [Pelotomaculum sp.]